MWKQIDKSHFERTIFENGKLLATRRIQISDDGQTLTEDTERTLADGKKAVATMRFRRTTGEPQGLAAISGAGFVSQLGSQSGDDRGDRGSLEGVEQSAAGLHGGA